MSTPSSPVVETTSQPAAAPAAEQVSSPIQDNEGFSHEPEAVEQEEGPDPKLGLDGLIQYWENKKSVGQEKPKAKEAAADASVPEAPVAAATPSAPDSVQQAIQLQQFIQKQIQERTAQQPQQSQLTPQDIYKELVQQYSVQFPQDIKTALASGDPAQFEQTLGTLFAAQAARVHATLAAQFEERLTIAQQQAIQQAQQMSTVAQKRESTLKDLYSTYPSLNTEVGNWAITKVADTLMKEITARGLPVPTEWTPQLRDLIGKSAMAEITKAMPQGQGQPPAAQPGQGPAAHVPWTAKGGAPTQPKVVNNGPNSAYTMKTLFDD